MSELGKVLLLSGIILILAGVVVLILGKVPGFGKFPGDILIKKENFSFYFPVTTCIIISVILSLISWLWSRK